jgi:hypothetical protein
VADSGWIVAYPEVDSGSVLGSRDASGFRIVSGWRDPPRGQSVMVRPDSTPEGPAPTRSITPTRSNYARGVGAETFAAGTLPGTSVPYASGHLVFGHLLDIRSGLQGTRAERVDTRVARRPDAQLAASAAANRTTATPAKLSESAGFTPYSIPAIRGA